MKGTTKFKEQKYYISNPIKYRLIAVGISLFLLQLSSTWLSDLEQNRGRYFAIEWAFLVSLNILFFIQQSAKRVIIQGERIQYRNQFFRSKEYQICDILRIERTSWKSSKIVFYGNDGKRLFTITNKMQEVRWGIAYLERQKVTLDKKLKTEQLLWFGNKEAKEAYKEIYDAFWYCESSLIVRMLFAYRSNFSYKRIRYFISTLATQSKECEESAKKLIGCWDDSMEINKKNSLFSWSIKKQYLFQVERSERFYIRRNECEDKNILVEPYLPTKQGQKYIQSDEYYYSMKDMTNTFDSIEKWKLGKEDHSEFFFQTGRIQAAFYSILAKEEKGQSLDKPMEVEGLLNTSLQQIAIENVLRKRPESEIEEMNRILSQYFSVLPKSQNIVLSLQSFLVKEKEVGLTDEVLYQPTELQVELRSICDFMAGVIFDRFILTKNHKSKCWVSYLYTMLDGYSTVRQITPQERICLKPMLQLVILLKIASAHIAGQKTKDLVKLYMLVIDTEIN